jgi:hypothetical protein
MSSYTAIMSVWSIHLHVELLDESLYIHDAVYHFGKSFCNI